MNVEFNHCFGFAIYAEEAKKNMLKELNRFAMPADTKSSDVKQFFDKYIGLQNVVRVISPFLGIFSACMTLVTKIATVVEVIFKGLANVLGGLLGKKGYDAKMGAKQFSLALPCSIVDLIVGAPLHMAYNLIGDTLGTVIDPLKYVKKRCIWHEEKINQLVSAKSLFAASQCIVMKAMSKPAVAEIMSQMMNKGDTFKITGPMIWKIIKDDYCFLPVITNIFANMIIYGSIDEIIGNMVRVGKVKNVANVEKINIVEEDVESEYGSID